MYFRLESLILVESSTSESELEEVERKERNIKFYNFPPICKCQSFEDYVKICSIPLQSLGPDEIPAAALNFCSEVLAPHLSFYFNYLLAGGVFPSNLKTGYMIPIHKSDDKSLANNIGLLLFSLV
ncbi:hypothetical protein J6590_047918 [Homalodisca vitripennis]|nr:hypothetical protein J6590_047918 [Homalodisca vitripennis]